MSAQAKAFPLRLGIPGYTWEALQSPIKLAELHARFLAELALHAELGPVFLACRPLELPVTHHHRVLVRIGDELLIKLFGEKLSKFDRRIRKTHG